MSPDEELVTLGVKRLDLLEVVWKKPCIVKGVGCRMIGGGQEKETW